MEKIEFNNGELRKAPYKLDGYPKIGWFRNKNGLLLKTYGWVVQNAIGIIYLIHGFKAHTRINFMRKNLRMPNINEDLIADIDNYYIYKDSWIEKFNQNGYSVYALDLQGHGKSQLLGNLRGNFSSFDDLVDDVMQYMNQIQDEISNDNQTGDESYDIVPTKKKRLPMYIIGQSMGGSIALRVLQLLGKEKENNINSGDANNYKKCKAILDNSNSTNEIDNDMNNSNDYGFDNSCASTSATANAIANGKYEGYYNYLDKLNIKGCVSLSGMMRLKTLLGSGYKLFKYFYLPILSFLYCVVPHTQFSLKYRPRKEPKIVISICKRNKFINSDGMKLKCVYELIKAMVTLDRNISYMPKDIPLLFVHSKDDDICCYKGSVSFHNKANVKDKKLYIVEGMNHAISEEPGNEIILNIIIDWISNLRTNDEDVKDNKMLNVR
ncbi:lysophospholipase, putative [Plasmodium vinckei brucechwatti]|uniref:Lysophospholipase, putative n=1 Tax=Plasmodium vinckei brucechwatti TaxID=119398 RepID=A0A6V7S275_PLAVN|nr:lysophospholipase, putative [Plasmodium vinckei brucechwatti]